MLGLSPYRSNNVPSYFDDFEKAFFGGLPWYSAAFRTDILDKGDHFLLQAELPGVKKEDINIEIDGDQLSLSAVTSQSKEETKENYVRRERRTGSYSRSFDISGIDAEGISASYQNGVIELTLPKRTHKEPATKRIELQ